MRGCMVIKPWGYAIWENIQRRLDAMFKATGPRERVLPAVHPDELPGEGGGARRRVRQGVRGGDAPSAGAGRQGRPAAGAVGAAGRAAHRAADERDDHRRDVRPLGAVVSRPADSHQPMGQRRALGTADAAVPADDRVPVAGRAHGPRHRGRGPRRDACGCSTCTPTSPRTRWRCR